MKLEDFLSSDAYTPVNKALARHLGFVCAGFLGELIRQRARFGSPEFYFSQEDMEKEIGISAKVQRSCIGILVEKGYLSVDKHGAPCRNWYIINDCAILNCYSFDESGGQTRCAQTAQLDVPKGNNLMCPNGTTYNNKETNKENKKESELSLSEQETQDNTKERKENVAAKEKKERSQKKSKKRMDYPEDYEKIWRIYPHNHCVKQDVYGLWQQYSEEEKARLLIGAQIQELEWNYVKRGTTRMSNRMDRWMDSYTLTKDWIPEFVDIVDKLNNIQDEQTRKEGLDKAREYFGEDYVRTALSKVTKKITLEFH